MRSSVKWKCRAVFRTISVSRAHHSKNKLRKRFNVWNWSDSEPKIHNHGLVGLIFLNDTRFYSPFKLSLRVIFGFCMKKWASYNHLIECRLLQFPQKPDYDMTVHHRTHNVVITSGNLSICFSMRVELKWHDWLASSARGLYIDLCSRSLSFEWNFKSTLYSSMELSQKRTIWEDIYSRHLSNDKE